MRQETQLEALKQRIAQGARKAGLDSEFETLEKNIKREPPPDVPEWWDAALLPNKSYDDDLAFGFEYLNIRTQDSPVTTLYIQHPIPIPGFGEKNKVNLRPLKLTAKARYIVLLSRSSQAWPFGWVSSDPPKVRLANLMKVLTSDAVQDPTRVEARLTDEQRRERIENKKLEEEKKGAVFKVKNLSDPAHRFDARKNAEQMNLTGLCIFNPAFSMVYVEGAQKLIRQSARPRGGEDVEIKEGDDEGGINGKGEARADDAVNGEGEGVTSLEDNACYLVWEGQLRERSFNSFKPRSCPTDATAKEALGQKLAAYWDMVKNWNPEEEELF
ncbi:pre-mRNA processing factor 3-domain-containing protein [Boletus edulis]|nr:pre-mRNA processing factor 3-domain-containing protein [Boletus edulis]